MYRGAPEPLVGRPDCLVPYHGKDGFNDLEFEATPDLCRVKDGFASDVIRKLVRENPGEVTLVTLGPLTNLALTFKTDPTIPALFRSIFIMGGNFEGMGNSTIGAEFNFVADAEAANIVLKNTRCPTYVATWELCVKYCNLTMVRDIGLST